MTVSLHSLAPYVLLKPCFENDRQPGKALKRNLLNSSSYSAGTVFSVSDEGEDAATSDDQRSFREKMN